MDSFFWHCKCCRQSLVIPEIRVISPVSGEILSGSDNLNQQPCYAPPYAVAGRLEHQLSSAAVHQESLPVVAAARQEGAANVVQELSNRVSH